MPIHIHDGDIHVLDIKTRMPFRYGIATMTTTPHAFVRLRVEIDGKLATGIAADHLPPRWFTKDPAQTIEYEIAVMLDVIAHAVASATSLRAPSTFAAWRRLYDIQGYWGATVRLPPLLTHFGTSLVERALIDAVCRHADRPFHELLHSELIGIDLGQIHPDLAGVSPRELLPDAPLERIVIRHTVGLADPLVESDIAEHERCDDGLPQSLAACIRTYGLRQFKIKVSGDIERDRERLTRIAEVIAAHAPADFGFSLDGNEQFRTAEQFREFWGALSESSALKDFFRHLLFVEQPLHRDVALKESFLDWPTNIRIIIDESDGELTSLPTALGLGYAGTSHKNCKGVFKGIANRCLINQRESMDYLRPSLMTGEDLANIGPVALLQDLAVCALLGLQGVERNGHHYFAGLSMFPREVQEAVLRDHGDLYERTPSGWSTLRITDGSVAIGSLNAAPFGTTPLVEVEQFRRVEG